MRLYLDTCCLNRPWDDLRQLRVQLEADVVLAIAKAVDSGGITLCGSAILDLEIARNPDADRRFKVQEFVSKAGLYQEWQPAQRARAERLILLGFRPLDAAHVASAEALDADLLLTTDDQFLATARRHQAGLAVKIENPLSWATFKP